MFIVPEAQYVEILDNVRSLRQWRARVIDWTAFWFQHNLLWFSTPDCLIGLLENYDRRRRNQWFLSNRVLGELMPLRFDLYNKLMDSEDGRFEIKNGFRLLANTNHESRQFAYVILIALLENKTAREILEVCLGICPDCNFGRRILRDRFFDGDFDLIYENANRTFHLNL